MQTLERRIVELEKASTTTEGTVIVIHAGELNAEIGYLRTDDGQQWMREPHETEHAFKERAYGEVKRTPYGVAVLFTFD